MMVGSGGEEEEEEEAGEAEAEGGGDEAAEAVNGGPEEEARGSEGGCLSRNGGAVWPAVRMLPRRLLHCLTHLRSICCCSPICPAVSSSVAYLARMMNCYRI
ncbi:hypothetical protein B296_00038464 [Ensete ventricosum]|uniref:Uncharacterized protein n=1 Tax=Ensete ventricosum TaxID=4639 RepID=A0A426Y1X7_ENSVE|nr:hypothetical protein B296_00038464 [Ensete ventricosum]